MGIRHSNNAGLTSNCRISHSGQSISNVSKPLNLVTDSAYVANVVKRIEGSLLKEVDNEDLYCYLVSMQRVLQQRKYKYFISHIRAHSSLTGFLAEGNEQADELTMMVSNTLPDIFEQAKLSHVFFHQNARALLRTFHIPKIKQKPS